MCLDHVVSNFWNGTKPNLPISGPLPEYTLSNNPEDVAFSMILALMYGTGRIYTPLRVRCASIAGPYSPRETAISSWYSSGISMGISTPTLCSSVAPFEEDIGPESPADGVFRIDNVTNLPSCSALTALFEKLFPSLGVSTL